MAFQRQSKDEFDHLADINVTPLVDVMLVLLIIFMVTAPMLHQGISVALPKTATTTCARPSKTRSCSRSRATGCTTSTKHPLRAGS